MKAKLLGMLVVAAALSAQADTVAWWHFDECDPGTTAPANTVASDQAPTTYAHVYTVGDSSSMATLVENGGDYLPTYTKPFRGLAVYDPVSDTTRTNRAAMKFRVDSGGSTSVRAYYGGALKFEGGYDLYQSLYGTSALTVEAFVCTTGGTYNLFAPIVGSVGGMNSWTSERFALYMQDDGTIAVRLTTSEGSTLWYDSGDRGNIKINDGAWHHVAFTYDGAYMRIYVDYSLDKKATDGSDRVYVKTGTIPTYSKDNATWIGGYAREDGSGGRKFPGVIDEVRVSSAALTPDQFLRMQPIDMDPDEIVRVSFTPDEYGLMLKKDYAHIGDMLRSNSCDLAVFRKVSNAGSSVLDTETKVGAVMAAKLETDCWIENAASFYQATNDAGVANYIQMPKISALIRGNDGTNASYTVEMFYKTRNTVRGTTAEQRQVLMKLGSGSGYFNVLFRGDEYLFYVCKAGEDHYDSVTKNTDDGKWHHVAVVVDGAAQKVSFYSDYRHEKSQTGALPDIGSGTSIFFGAKESGSGQWFDGWIDDIRVTRRALGPSEFLTTHPVGSGNASMLALFEQNYDFTCASNAAFNVTGVGEARTGGNAPTFVKESRGSVLLDGTNSTAWAANEWSVRLDSSRVVFPSVNFFEADAYTVEFWAKFDGIVDSGGAVDADSTSLSQNLPVMRLVRSDITSEYDWYVFRKNSDPAVVQMAIGGKYPAWNIPSGHFVDRKWHHYAFTFEPIDDGTKTSVKFFYDYANVEYEKDGGYVPGFTLNARLPQRIAGHNLMLGEGSNDQPNIVGEFDAIRVTKGVLDPSKFLARKPSGFMLFIR